MLHWLARAAGPWNALFADNALISTTVLFVHLAAIVVAAGTAMSADGQALRSLRFPEMRARYLEAAAFVHRTVVLALVVAMVAGFLLFLSDVEEFAESNIFCVKLALIFLLLANGFAITRIEKRLLGANENPPDLLGWSQLRLAARASQTLWFATILAGVALRNI